MKFLVTGAAGMIGANLALHLESQGHTVHALDGFAANHKQNLRNFKGLLHQGDVRTFDYDSLGSLDGIFHHAAVTDTAMTDENLVFSVNVNAFARILDYAKRSGCPKVIYASSAATYGKAPVPMREGQPLNPGNVYGLSKVKMEEVALDFAKRNPEVHAVGLRYFNVYGPLEFHKKSAASMIYQLYRQITTGKPPRVFKWGEQFRDFIYVKDVILANMKALVYPGSAIFNVGTGIKTTFNQVIEVLNSTLDVEIPTSYIDNPYSFFQEGTQADIGLAEKELGFKPSYLLERGIRDYVDFLLEMESAYTGAHPSNP